jgi:PAS domain S-box-containing protein
MTTANGAATVARKSLVFVDNDNLILEAMTELLSAEGYTVHVARDGLEALAVIREVKPDFIILDIVLPKLDGSRVCAAVRQDPTLRNTPIIAFSSLSPQDYRFFPQLSADAYVAKGRLATSAHNILTAISHFESEGPERGKGQLLGYENFRSRQLVNELLRERRHLAAILRVLAPGALELDRDGQIVWANPGACEILGRKEAELVGEGFASLAPSLERKGIQDLLADLVKSEEPAQHVTALYLEGAIVAVRLAPIVESNACSGILVLLDCPGKGSDSRTDSSEGDL